MMIFSRARELAPIEIDLTSPQQAKGENMSFFFSFSAYNPWWCKLATTWDPLFQNPHFLIPSDWTRIKKVKLEILYSLFCIQEGSQNNSHECKMLGYTLTGGCQSILSKRWNDCIVFACDEKAIKPKPSKNKYSKERKKSTRSIQILGQYWLIIKVMTGCQHAY